MLTISSVRVNIEHAKNIFQPSFQFCVRFFSKVFSETCSNIPYHFSRSPYLPHYINCTTSVIYSDLTVAPCIQHLTLPYLKMCGCNSIPTYLVLITNGNCALY